MKNPRFTVFVFMLVIILQTVELLGFIYFIRSNLIHTFLNGKKEQQLFTAKQIVLNLESDIHGVEDKLKLLSLQQSVLGDVPTCQEEFKKVSSILYQKVGNLARLNKKGIVDCSLDPKILNVGGNPKGHVKQIFEDPHHESVFGPMKPSALNKGMTSVMHVPLFNKNGVFIGTIGAPILFNELEEKYLKNILIDPRLHLVIVDTNGDILYDKNKGNIGKNAFSDSLKNDVYFNQLSQLTKKALAENDGSTTLRSSLGEQIAAYSVANVFKERKWVVILTASTKDIISEFSQNGFAGMNPLLTIVFSIIFILVTAKIFLFFFLKYQMKN